MLQHLAPSSKLWIYQSNRSLNTNEVSKIRLALETFVTDWQSHGSPLTAGFDIFENRFVAIAIDETNTPASGCSIDKSLGIIRSLDEQLQCGFLDRGVISYLDENLVIQTLPFNKIKNAVETQQILPHTIIYNNNIDQLGLLDSSWKVKAIDSWLSRFFSKSIVA